MTDTVTILGRVGGDPTNSATTTGVPVTNFRLASTQRRFDQRSQAWVDLPTNWYTVAAFRQLGEHAKASLRSGDAVIVTGRLKVREWENNSGKKMTSVDIEAEAIGHDLRWGTSAYARASRNAAASQRDHPEAVRAEENRHSDGVRPGEAPSSTGGPDPAEGTPPRENELVGAATGGEWAAPPF